MRHHQYRHIPREPSVARKILYPLFPTNITCSPPKITNTIKAFSVFTLTAIWTFVKFIINWKVAVFIFTVGNWLVDLSCRSSFLLFYFLLVLFSNSFLKFLVLFNDSISSLLLSDASKSCL